MPERDVVLHVDELDGTNGYVIEGTQVGDRFGRWVSAAGDVNGDTRPDIIIGAPVTNTSSTSDGRGAAFVIFGGASQLSALDGNGDGRILATDLNGANGFRIEQSIDSGQFGASVGAAGDINGDTIDDIIVGAPYADGGRAYVIFGRSSGFASSISADVTGNGSLGYIFTPEGPNAFERLGDSVAGVGDVNGDGIDDVVIGASYADPFSPGTNDSAGAAYLVFGGTANLVDLDDDDGATTGVIDLENLTAGKGATFSQNGGAVESIGFDVAKVGDVNGDGYDDFAIGARFNDPISGSDDLGEGSAHIVFGRPSTVPFAELRDFSSETGAAGFTIAGSASLDQLGRAVAGGGDINGDGFDDIVVSAPYADPFGETSAGSVYVLFGKNTFRGTEDISLLDGTNGFRLDGARASDFTGTSANILGDVNGDGFDDIGIGALLFDTIENNSVGTYYVVFGSAGGFGPSLDLTRLNGNNGFRIEGADASRDLGRYTGEAIGDINGDGLDDILVGGEGSFSSAGEAYIVFGQLAESDVVRIGSFTSQTQNGGLGNDLVQGNGGNDTLIGHAGIDTLEGGTGDDSLDGGADADLLFGGSGLDTLFGGLGSDFLVVMEDGPSDIFDGGGGEDQISFREFTGGVTASLATASFFAGGPATALSLTSVEGIEGSASGDSLTGDGLANTLTGGLGADMLFGGDGGDLLIGDALAV